MGSKKKKKGKGKGKGGDPQDPVVLIVSRACAQTLYDILPSLYACIPDLFQALALSLGISGSSMKKKKGGKGGGKKAGGKSGQVISDEIFEDVSGSVFAPRRAASGEGFLVQVFAHLPGVDPVALTGRATEAEPRAVRVGSDRLYEQIKRGTTLTFTLSMKKLKIDQPQQDRVWRGHTIGVQFGVTIPKAFKPGSMYGNVVVSAETLPILL